MPGGCQDVKRTSKGSSHEEFRAVLVFEEGRSKGEPALFRYVRALRSAIILGKKRRAANSRNSRNKKEAYFIPIAPALRPCDLATFRGLRLASLVILLQTIFLFNTESAYVNDARMPSP